MDVVVAGGGMVGLASALMLARRGHEVTVLERDAAPADGGPDDDAQGWHRPGVPQAVHAHVFLARSARVLREELPDVLDAVLARGVWPSGRDLGPGYEDDTDLQARRLVLEAVLRRVAQAEPRVEIRAGVRLTGLATRDGPRRRVTGVVTTDDGTVSGDLVVDALGRRSPAPRWLRAIDAPPPAEEHHPFDVHYFARHYRFADGDRPDRSLLPDATMTPWGLFLVFGGDNDTYSLAGGLSLDDPHRGALRDPEVFDRVLSAVEGIGGWAERGEPITDVHLMGGLANRRRRLVVDGEPIVDGYVLVGDASLYTNATFGQGVSLGLWQAQALVRCLEEVDDPAGGLAPALESWTARWLDPRFDEQVAVDAQLSAMFAAGLSGDPVGEPPPERRPAVALQRLAAEGDPVVAPARRRVRHLLAEADELARDPAVTDRIEAFLAADPALALGHGGLARHEFERLVTG